MPSTSVLAEPATDARVLRLKRGEERRLSSGHLWVFSNEIDTDSTPLSAFEPGALAQLRSHRDAFLGYVYVNPHALICARILSRDLERAGRLSAPRAAPARGARVCASALRPLPYYRWVFGESDLLPGLVLDRYGDVIVGQIATAGMEALKEEVAAAVRARACAGDALLEERLGCARSGAAAEGDRGRLRPRARRSSPCRSAG